MKCNPFSEICSQYYKVVLYLVYEISLKCFIPDSELGGGGGGFQIIEFPVPFQEIKFNEFICSSPKVLITRNNYIWVVVEISCHYLLKGI